MRDRPTGPELLDAAEAAFRERLLPALPAELRYEALMALNAIGIAARQARAGDRPLEAARARLAALLDDGEATLEALERRFAAEIRAGRFDPGAPSHEAAFAHLWETARAKAAESNPKALEAAERAAAGAKAGGAGDAA